MARSRTPPPARRMGAGIVATVRIIPRRAENGEKCAQQAENFKRLNPRNNSRSNLKLQRRAFHKPLFRKEKYFAPNALLGALMA
jgi:hypothetical protein